MKKLIIAGSSKLQDRINYWHGYFEGQGYEVIDYPSPVPFDTDHASEITDVYTSFYQNLDRADVFFLMNEDKDGIGGYIGPSAIAEVTYAIISNLNHGKKIEINLLQMPSAEQNCYEEVNFWLSQDWVKIYQRPGSKKLPKIPEVVVEATPDNIAEEAPEITAEADSVDLPVAPVRHKHFLSPSSEKRINILSCRKRCLRNLTPAMREYLNVISNGDFPAWLLKYIAAPEMQRLHGVTNTCGIDQGGLYNFSHHVSTFAHSIGVALIVWRFSHDKKQTLAALFHDIACPAFHHTIDYLNDDAETQESTEERTGEIIRNSRTITRQLKRDEIMPSEVSDYKLFPLADNDLPALAADRLEYTLANGYFLFDVWTLDDVKRFSDNLTVLKNEHDIDEIGFQDAEICQEFTTKNLAISAEYRSDKCVVSMQFIADILKSMMLRDYLTIDDLYAMSEREVVDWILSCGDKTLSEAFRNFQRATSIYTSGSVKKDRYCTTYRAKVRYITPLVEGQDGHTRDQRITELSTSTDRAVQKYLNTKTPKYVGFDFEFTPYSE